MFSAQASLRKRLAWLDMIVNAEDREERTLIFAQQFGFELANAEFMSKCLSVCNKNSAVSLYLIDDMPDTSKLNGW